jgi:hypothetical protein
VEPALSSILLVFALVALTVAAGLAYLRRARVERPPVGVFNLRDVLFTAVLLVVVPPLYLRLPRLAVAAVLVLAATGILYFTLAPLAGRRLALLAAIGLVALDIALALFGAGTDSPAFPAVNNLLLVAIAVGVCNIWAQSGIRARDVAVFAAALTIYDAVATLALPLMVEFFARVTTLPLAPALGWGRGSGMVAIGLGDVLVLVLWTLACEVAFSRAAALTAGALGLACALALFAVFWADLLNRPLPAMVLLGPVIVAHYAWLRRRFGRERRIGAYLLAGPAPPAAASAAGGAAPSTAPLPATGAAPARPAVDVGAALAWLPEPGDTAPAPPGRYLALHGKEVVGQGWTAAEAARAARRARPGEVPLVVLEGRPQQQPRP